jgi:putative oxidoreductase
MPLPTGAMQPVNRHLSLAVRCLRLLYGGAERLSWPWVDLLLRLALAQSFLMSMSTTLELVSAALLICGLLTRLAVLPLLGLAVLSHLHHPPMDLQLYRIALLGWYFVMGPGPLSLDVGLQGLARSALPGSRQVAAATEFLARYLGPLYTLALRLWLAAALCGTGGVLSAWLPEHSTPHLAAGAAFMFGLLLASGFTTRLSAAALMLGVGAMAMIDADPQLHGYWLGLLAILALRGPGPLSLDAALRQALCYRFPELVGKPPRGLAELPRVVIVGAGFGGLSCADALRDAAVSITVVDRVNYHLFQPLLYQVATAAVSPGDIATPVRTLFRESLNTRVLLGEVLGVDPARRRVSLGDTTLEYDYLVLATGATHSYFGNDQWREHAPGLKCVEDATEIRRRILVAFERAEATEDEAERAALLTFLIVGGGPTGVELAGAIAELAHFGMQKDFRRFDPASARILLVQSGPRILPAFPERLSARARSSLERLGVAVLTHSRVESIDAEGVIIGGRAIAARTVLWAAGVVSSPAAHWLGAEADTAGRTKVEPDLSVPHHPEVFVIGDAALSHAWAGQPVPGLAPAAKQQGAYVARLIRCRVRRQPVPPPFSYRHLGSLATIGRKAAVADFTWIRLSGPGAWWLWGLVHLGFLVGVRNRATTLLNWFWSYLTFSGGIRLITGSDRS